MNKLHLFFWLLVVIYSPLTAWGDSLQVNVLDVGQGECILISDGNSRLLYDGGPRETSSYVVSRLEQLGVDYLDYVISSHYDEDHLAGLIGVLHKIPVGLVLASDYEADTEIYASFNSILEEKQISLVMPAVGDIYPFRSYDIQIIGPGTLDQDQIGENDHSLAVRITNGEEAILICGDAEGREEQYILEHVYELSADIYIVNHHGSNSSSGEAFLEAAAPGLSIICCGSDNEYGHPHQEVLERLEQVGSTVLRTDQLGEISISTDGSGGIQIAADFVREKEADGSGSMAGQTDTISEIYNYVCNINTMVFHFPDCASVNQMSEKNKLYSEHTREELIDEGYRPCKNCEP